MCTIYSTKFNVFKSYNTTNVFELYNNTTMFKLYNEGMVYTIYNICIEIDPTGRNVLIDLDTKVPRKILVIYNKQKSGWTKLKASTARKAKDSFPDRSWDILETHKSIPITHKYITEYPAYFTIPSFIGNLPHLWEDYLVGLYGVLKATNMLGVMNGSQLYLNGWEIRSGTWGWYNSSARKERYQDLICPLGVRDNYYIYHSETPNTCFKNAVFSLKPVQTQERVDYLNTKLLFDPDKCKINQITLIQRNYRKIINIEELKQVAIELGFPNISIVYFDRLTVLEQYQLARCTDILIGMNGAALQWAVFMKPKRGLLEMSYHGFDVFFNKYQGHNGLVYQELMAVKQIKNWDTYKLLRHSGELSESQKQTIYFPVKDSDGIFDPNHFKAKLANITHAIFK